MKKLSVGCTLDCFDCCKFNVFTEAGKVIKIEGDKEHPYTKGFICKKGLAHLDRTYHSDRQYKPLIKKDGSWQEIFFEEALTIMADKLKFYKESYGTHSILYYEQYGSGSLLKSIGELFFNFFGGVSKQKGGPCWSAGTAAQKKNFGDVRSHALEDMLNSKHIIVWGKNPASTTIHTMQMIQKAKSAGIYVTVIDPICTRTAQLASEYIAVRPGGDGALALAMTQVILERQLYDKAFVKQHVEGFEAYREYVMQQDFAALCKAAGIGEEIVTRLAIRYVQQRSSILLGYGMQKYKNGGNTICLINALGAVAGQIGRSGGGVNYANRVYPNKLSLDPYNSESYAENRFFYVSDMSAFIRQEQIKMAVITKSNLLNQLPDLNSLEEAMSSIEFKVCFDQFLTDTAQACDLFIPCSTVLESEDLLFSSMTNPYLTYNEKAIEPRERLMDEYAFYQALAQKLTMSCYPQVSKSEYLTKVIEPLKAIEPEISLQYLKDHYFTLHKPVAWEDKKFATPSGKFEIYFNKEVNFNEQSDEKYPFRLLTNHSKDTLFSQHFMDEEGRAKAYINSRMAQILKKADGETVCLKSAQGSIEAVLQVDEGIGDFIVMMHAGWWRKHGNPNVLTQSGISDIGGQVTYNETRVSITSCYACF